MTHTIDERENLPSASTMARTVGCPGWLQLAATCPTPADNKLSAQGTRIHAAYETGDTEDLDETEEQITHRIEGLTASAYTAWVQQHPDITDVAEMREQRLWVRERQTLDKVASAKVDRAYKAGVYALVIDAKTGFKDTTPSERNWQIRTQALALWHEHPELEEIVGGVAAYRLKDRLDISGFTRNDLLAIEREIVHASWKSRQKDAMRQAGDWCEYCPAKGGYCPESAVYVATVPFGFQSLKPVDLVLAVQHMPLESVVKLWEKEGLVKKIFESVKERLKALPLQEMTAVGIGLKKGATNRHVTDSVKALSLLKESGLLTQDQALACFKPSLTAIEKVIKDHSDMTKDSVKQKVETILESVIERTPNAPSLIKL